MILRIKQHEILLDDDLSFNVYEYTWYITRSARGKTYYAINRKTEMGIHHFVLGYPPDGFEVDHINGNGLDNRRENLRFVTKSQNNQNVPKKEGTSSQYIGVGWRKDRGKWRAKSNRAHIGYFDDEVEAAKAYDDWARRTYGIGARTNF